MLLTAVGLVAVLVPTAVFGVAGAAKLLGGEGSRDATAAGEWSVVSLLRACGRALARLERLERLDRAAGRAAAGRYFRRRRRPPRR